MLLDPEARSDVLLDWETQWLPVMMPSLKHSVELRPDNDGLARLERDILADPVAGPLHRDHASAPTPFYDGSELPLHHALHGPGWLTTCLAEPITAPGALINFSIYMPGDSLTCRYPGLTQSLIS